MYVSEGSLISESPIKSNLDIKEFTRPFSMMDKCHFKPSRPSDCVISIKFNRTMECYSLFMTPSLAYSKMNRKPLNKKQPIILLFKPSRALL